METGLEVQSFVRRKVAQEDNYEDSSEIKILHKGSVSTMHDLSDLALADWQKRLWLNDCAMKPHDSLIHKTLHSRLSMQMQLWFEGFCRKFYAKQIDHDRVPDLMKKHEETHGLVLRYKTPVGSKNAWLDNHPNKRHIKFSETTE